MGRRSRSERLTSKGRPKRRAAKTHFFKYQLATNPSRAEENDLKRALQESLEEHHKQKNSSGKSNGSRVNSVLSKSGSSADVSLNNSKSSSNESEVSVMSSSSKRTRSSNSSLFSASPIVNTKRTKLNGHSSDRFDDVRCNVNDSPKSNSSFLSTPAPPSPITPINKAIKTYSRNQPVTDTQRTHQQETRLKASNGVMTSSPIPVVLPSSSKGSKSNHRISENSSQSSVSRSTQTPGLSIVKLNSPVAQDSSKGSSTNLTIAANRPIEDSSPATETLRPPVQEQYLKFKRESKNYAYVKMTALKVSTSKSPSSNSKSSNYKKCSPNTTPHCGGMNKNLSAPSSSCKASLKASDNNSLTKTVKQRSEIETSSKHDSCVENAQECERSNPTVTVKTASRDDKESRIDNHLSNAMVNNGKTLDQDNSSPKTSSKLCLAIGKDLSSDGKRVSKAQSSPQESSTASTDGSKNDCLPVDDALDLSDQRNQSQLNVKVIKKRVPQGSWSLLGVPEEKVIYLRDDEPPRRLICYPAIKHAEGDVIQVRDSVLLRSGARKTDLPYIAKVCAFWEDAETGSVMMSLLWYYRPEHTEEGRKSHHLPEEIFASRHRDMDSVECIEDKCYVLTFNEYCRYRRRFKMEQVNTTWSLTDVTIPVSNESYPRRNRIPESDVNPELVFCCRQIYDSRMRRLVKNPLINPKYGHI